LTWVGGRTAAALLLGTAATGLPFLTVGGESALRFDVAEMKLHVLGSVLWVEEFPLLLLSALFLLLLTIAVTVAFGRGWCGWGCPQAALPLLAGRVASLLPRPLRPPARHALLLLLGGVTALALVGYFVPPGEALRTAGSRPFLLGSLLVLWGTAYGVPALAGPAFCRTVCPYAMLQNVLVDRDTLLVAFDGKRSLECLECGACIRACPVGIDIREGFQRECLACATCVDACREVTAPAGIEPFLGYRGTVLRPKTYLLFGASAGLLLLLGGLAASRPAAALALRWDGGGDGRPNRYAFRVRNNTAAPLAFRVELPGIPPPAAWGDTSFTVPPGRRTAGNLFVRAPGGTERVAFRFLSGTAALTTAARYAP
jgi:ferredoxin